MIKKCLSIVLAAIVIACSSSDDPAPDNNNGGTDPTDDGPIASFDRSAMLTNWADNIIVPAYEEFLATAEALQQQIDNFNVNTTEDNLNLLRDSWLTAYKSFQWVSMFEIGPAEDARFRARLNTYPADAATIDDFRTTGVYNFELPSNIDAQGFPAFDYMLFGLADTDAAILEFYTTDASASIAKIYLQDLATAMTGLAQQVLNEWNSGFATSFKANTDASANGSIDKLTNDYIFYYEKALRAGKIGIPAGVFSTDPLPGNVEAFYNQEVSRELVLEALQAAQNFFNGNGNGTGNGRGFKSYLDFLNTIKNGEDLSTLINDQFDLARTEIEELSNNFVSQIQSNNTAMLEAYDELQRNVILIKVDMLQALSIDVDFVDTDGD